MLELVAAALVAVTTYTADVSAGAAAQPASRPMRPGATVMAEARAGSDWGAAHPEPAAVCAAATRQDGSDESRCGLATFGQDAPQDAPCARAAAAQADPALRRWYSEAAAVCDCIDGGRSNPYCK
jgi:hypothetical protein